MTPLARSMKLTAEDSVLLELLVGGQSNKQIAHEFGITVSGASQRVARLLDRLKLRNRVQIAVWAVCNGVVKCPSKRKS